MEFDNHILVVIFIISLVSSISVEGSNLSPSEKNEIADEVKRTFGPVSSLDLEKIEDAFSPFSSLEEVKEELGPISSWDEAKEALGSVLDDAFGPISPSTLDDAKEEALGPASSKVVDKAKQHFDSITQDKEDVSSDAQNLDNDEDTSRPISSSAPTPISPSTSSKLIIDDEAKQKFDSFVSQNKQDISSEEAQKKKIGPNFFRRS